MERWHNRVAVVTGASSGIGAEISLDLVRNGMIVVALARREQRLIALREQLAEHLKSKFHTLKCDVTDEADVKRIFQWIDEHLSGGISVLINNAGVLPQGELTDCTVDFRSSVDTNIMGVVYCTRETFKIMRSHGIDDGHIVVINSVLGHQTPPLNIDLPSFNIYPATKHALRSMTETYRQEFLRCGTKIRITSISPGGVDTDIFSGEMANIIKSHMPLLKPKDVSNAVVYALAAPPHVQIYELIIKPVGEVL